MTPRRMIGLTLFLHLVLAGPWAASEAPAQMGACAGDCNHDELVTIDELVVGTGIVLGRLQAEQCPELDPQGGEITVADLVAAVSRALTGCDVQANRPPQASGVSFAAELSTPYVERQLIGSDPDGDTIVYELVGGDAGDGYSFAYLNPDSGVLYVTLAAGFRGAIVLPYRVTDGSLFSATASVTIEVGEAITSNKGGVQPVDPREYASYPRGFYYGALLGAPGANPTLPSSVDLSSEFPLPGDQGRQNSCVGWALGYAIKSYQERRELGWSLQTPEHLFSPAYIYNQLNGGQDLGLVYLHALDFIVENGAATLAKMPYDQSDFLSQPSTAAHQEASRYKARLWKGANGVLDVKAALANRLPVFMVIQVMRDIHGLRGPNSVYNSYGGGWETGHGVAAVGYDDNKFGGAFKIINSWGQDFGDGGYFWMPYSSTTAMVDTGDGPRAVLTGAVVVEDAANPELPGPDPVDPRQPGELPDLQVTNWSATYNGMPGGSGALQYTVTNTGTATAPAGTYVALVLSHDATFRAGNVLVVYEPIPFDMAPGTTAYRDANNAVAFNFPGNLEAGQYYMAAWADAWNGVAEANENDNISPATSLIDIVNTLPDMHVASWYANWDDVGDGALVYELANIGASVAPAGWLITLALSPDDVIGDGDELFLVSEPAAFDVEAGGTLYRDESSAIGFSLYYDIYGNAVPDGVYYISLWLDPNGWLAESNDINNASVSWGTIGIGGWAAATGDGAAASSTDAGQPIAGEAYNGKSLPPREGSVRKVRLSTRPDGSRHLESLGQAIAAPGSPRLRATEATQAAKIARARQQVIFPVTEMKPMPAAGAPQ